MDYMIEQYELTANSISSKFDDFNLVLETNFEKNLREKLIMENAKYKKELEIITIILQKLNKLNKYYELNKINDFIDYTCIKHELESSKFEEVKVILVNYINKNSTKKITFDDISYNNNLVKIIQYFNVKKNLLVNQLNQK